MLYEISLCEFSFSFLKMLLSESLRLFMKWGDPLVVHLGCWSDPWAFFKGMISILLFLAPLICLIESGDPMEETELFLS